jgi:hypothetical protein
MLALHRSRWPLHSTQWVQIRTLRTLPRPIPSYIKSWDPVLHEPVRQFERPTVFRETGNPAAQEHLQKHFKEKIKEKGLHPTEHHTYKKLRHVLKLVISNPAGHDDTRKHVWKAYERAKGADKELLSCLSPEDWDRLWSAQAFRSVYNFHRTSRLIRLYQDMNSVGMFFTLTQWREYLECLSLSGRENQALMEWRLQESYSDHPEHLELGVKLHALAGNADSAREIMDDLLEKHPDWDPSIMMNVFRALTSSELMSDHVTARALYDRMKGATHPRMTLAQYDSCFVGFLEAKHVKNAQQVFRDMFSDGSLSATGIAEDVERVLERLHMLYRLGTDISTMTTIALDALSILPVAYHGYLFGDWMKLTVIEKQPGATAKILDMMYRRGYAPETYHLNMLLRALIRTRETPNILRAENIGWRMIDEAQKAHFGKHESLSTAAPTSDQEPGQATNIEALRNLPPADASTFALIMHHHGKSLQWEHVDYISRQLKETDVIPNTAIMNVLIDNKTRKGAFAEAWSIYQQLTNPTPGSRGVFPDGSTIRHLWKMLRLALGDHATRTDPALPIPRDLLKETVDWWKLCRQRPDAKRFHLGLAATHSVAIPGLMLHCFSYTIDLPGALIALHVLRHHFQIFPNDRMVEIVQRQMAWINVTPGSGMYFHSRDVSIGRQRVERLYDDLANRRLKELREAGRNAEDMSAEEVGDVRLNLLSEFVRAGLKRTYPDEVVEEMVIAAQVRVGYLGPTGDKDAFEV